MELGRYRGEVQEDPPVGVDLDESGELLTLDQMSRWADTDAEPDWPALRDAAAGGLERSRDLRAAVYLCAALLNTEGVRAFSEGLSLLRHYVEELWDEVYPKLDGEDATERTSAVFNLVNFHRVIRPLNRAPLVEDRAAGRFSLQDMQIARGVIDPPADLEGDPPQESLILAAFQAMDRGELEALDAGLGQGIADLQAIEECFSERAGPTSSPDLSRLRDVLSQMHALTRGRLDEGRQVEDGAVPADSPADAGAGHGSGDSAPATVGGPIRTRQEAVRTIDQVIQYFRANEPSSPVPLLLGRAKRLVDMDFMAILEDIAPEGVNQAKTISGKSVQE